MTARSLDRYRDFSGSADELARLASELCSRLGLATEELTVRLVRDYAQRNILSRPERQGKEAVYSWRHLVELLAARVLLEDGWPLAKIAEHVALTPVEDLLLQVPGQEGGNKALEAARRIRAQTRGGSKPTPRRADAPSALAPLFARQQLAVGAKRRSDLSHAMQLLGSRSARPAVAPLTRIALDDDIQLLVATARLQTLTLDEAEAIGRALTASLIDCMTAKGGKQP